MVRKLKPWGNGDELPEEFDVDHSSLILHMRTGNADAIRAFLAAQPQWLNYYYCGSSLLHHATDYDYPEVLAVLVELGLDVNTPQEHLPWGPLDQTVLNGYVASARFLLEQGAKTTYQHQGLTFSCHASYAVDSGNFEMVKLLVDHGIPLDVQLDGPQHSLLSSVILQGHTEIADYLRSKGALTDEEIKARAKMTRTKT